MSMDPDTPSDSNDGEKKSVRLRLNRKAPRPVEEEAAPSVSNPSESDAAPTGETRRPMRMRLNRKEEEGDDEAQPSPTADEPESDPAQAVESPFGDDDFEDFDGPEIAPPPEEPASTEEPPPPETSTSAPPTRFRLKTRKAGESEDDSVEVARTRKGSPPPIQTSQSGGDDEGWDGAPESQLTPPSGSGGDEDAESRTKSGLRLKSKEPVGGEMAPPEGTSHGTLTPFERDQDLVGPNTPPPLPKKLKKGKAPKKPTKASGKPQKSKSHPPAPPESDSNDAEVRTEKAQSAAGRIVLFCGLLFIFGLLGLGIMMVLGLGPFDHSEDPDTPPVVADTDNGTSENQDSATGSNPIQTTLTNIDGANRNNEEVDAIVAGDPTIEDSSSESSASEEAPAETVLNEDGQVVVKIDSADSDPGQGIVEGDTPVTVSSTNSKPIEEEEAPSVKPIPEIQSWINNMRINGSNTNRQTIIYNNNLYEKGGFVDFQRGIKFLGIRNNFVYFTDTRGAVYRREL